MQESTKDPFVDALDGTEILKKRAKEARSARGRNGLEDWLTKNGVRWEWSEGPEDELKY